jgi:CheY-like chemotaxis protein
MDRPLEILLVEDNPGDVHLVQYALNKVMKHYSLEVVKDGETALRYLCGAGANGGRNRPDLILLDLNLPRRDGREVLGEIKADPEFKSIPVIVLTTSDSDADVKKTYQLHANCFITKPSNVDELLQVFRGLREFWFSIARLPGW